MTQTSNKGGTFTKEIKFSTRTQSSNKGGDRCVSTLARSHSQELPETLLPSLVRLCEGMMRGRWEVEPFPASSLPA